MTTETPNLDAMDAEELRGFARDCRHSKLRRYALLKSSAVGLRLLGDVPAAMELESRCDNLYVTLPADLRW